jgi:hypothetical protein
MIAYLRDHGLFSFGFGWGRARSLDRHDRPPLLSLANVRLPQRP